MSYLSIPEVADLLAVSSATVRRRIDSGELRALKLGEAPNAPVKIPSAEVARFLRAAEERHRERAGTW